MKIQRIVKYYFLLVAVTFTGMSLIENPNVREYMANSLHIDLTAKEKDVKSWTIDYGIEKPIKKHDNKIYQKVLDTASSLYSVKVEFFGEPKHIYPEETEVNAFELAFRSNSGNLMLKELILTPNGITPDLLSEATLIRKIDPENPENTEIISKGYLHQGKIKFSNINFDPREPLTLALKFREPLLSGTHFSFLISDTQDVQIYTDGKLQTIDTSKTIDSPYITVIRSKLPQR